MNVEYETNKLRGLSYETLMNMLEIQVRKVLDFGGGYLPKDALDKIVIIISAALPLKNGELTISDPEVAQFLDNLFNKTLKDMTHQSDDSRVVSIWEEN